MSQLAQVAEIAGVSTADVVRVATGGGTTAADWAIAAALEQVTGRPAAETMWAGPSREARHTPQTAPANPEAKHDRTVTVYAEDSNGLVTDITESSSQPSENTGNVDELTAEVEEPGRPEWEHFLHTHIWADVAALTDAPRAQVARTVRPWTTAPRALDGVESLIAVSLAA